MKLLLSCLVVAASAAPAIPAHAAVAASEFREIAVPHGDLDLMSQPGMATLDRRIRIAAQSVCGVDEMPVGTRIRSPEAMQCYDRAMVSAKRQIALARADQAARSVRVASTSY